LPPLHDYSKKEPVPITYHISAGSWIRRGRQPQSEWPFFY